MTIHAPLFMVDVKDTAPVPDYRRWYRRGIARGVYIGVLVGMSISIAIVLVVKVTT